MPIIRDPTTIPSGGWQYPHPSGGLINGYNYALFFDKVRQTYQANGAPPPSDQEVIDWMCSNLYIPCVEGRIPFINKWTQGNPPAPASCCGGYVAPIL